MTSYHKLLLLISRLPSFYIYSIPVLFLQMLSSKDVNFVGYTYKNFEIVNDYQVPGMGTHTWSLALCLLSLNVTSNACFNAVFVAELKKKNKSKRQWSNHYSVNTILFFLASWKIKNLWSCFTNFYVFLNRSIDSGSSDSPETTTRSACDRPPSTPTPPVAKGSFLKLLPPEHEVRSKHEAC